MDIITIVRDPRRPLGKVFSVVDERGNWKKESVVSLSIGLAVQYTVPDALAMANVLKEVAEDPYAAICNAVFPQIPVGEEFLILSEDELFRTLSIERTTPRQLILGVHEVDYMGRPIKATGRLIENVKPSCWQLLDRDVDEYTPDRFATAPMRDWFGFVETLLPGVMAAAHVIVPSASSRVMLAGEPIGTGNGHVWIQVKDAADVVRTRQAIRLRALQFGINWAKPKRSQRSGEILPSASTCTVIDYVVWTPGRLVFSGKPTTIGVALTVAPADVRIVEGGRLDTSLATMPDSATIENILRNVGIESRVSVARDGALRIDYYDLRLDSLIDVEGEGELTVEQLMPRGGKIRCQSPFRESRSFAAFLSRGDEGRPFVYDVGTGETHWMASIDWLTAVRVLSDLRHMTVSEARAKWVAKCDKLSPSEADQVIDEVCRLTGISKRVANAELKEYRAQRRKEARERAMASKVGSREQIQIDVTRISDTAYKVKGLIRTHITPDACLVFGGALCRVADDAEFPLAHLADSEDEPVVMVRFVPHTESTLLAPIEKVVAFVDVSVGMDGVPMPRPIAVPVNIIRILRDQPEGLPECAGLLAAPVVLPSGRILTQPGLDPQTKLYVPVEAKIDGLHAYTPREALEAGKRLIDYLFDGFEFHEPLDGAVALSALFCLLQRRLMAAAPGLNIVAAAQSTGKTSLASRIVSSITGRPMPVLGLSLDSRGGSNEELDKQILACLIASPVAMVIDNLPDGTKFKSDKLAKIMTLPIYEGRLLGGNKQVQAPTNLMQILTGNNITLGLDEAGRFLTTRLVANTASPHKRSFRHPDVFRHALANRAQVVRDVVGIIAGYKLALEKGLGQAETRSRFSDWENYVRRPLLWACPQIPDVVDAFDREMDSNDIQWAQRATLLELARLYGLDQRFTAADITEKVMTMGSLPATEPQLRELLTGLGVQDPSNGTQLGRAMTMLLGKVFAGPSATLMKLDRWRTSVTKGYIVKNLPTSLQEQGLRTRNAYGKKP